MARFQVNEDNIVLVGSIDFTGSVSEEEQTEKKAHEFLLKIQRLMDSYDITKVDLAFDGLKIRDTIIKKSN